MSNSDRRKGSPLLDKEEFVKFTGNVIGRLEGVERRVVETHSILINHLEEEKFSVKKLEDVHRALFHPLDGLVNMKRWMCRIATWTGVILVGFLAAVSSVIAIGRDLGWW